MAEEDLPDDMVILGSFTFTIDTEALALGQNPVTGHVVEMAASYEHPLVKSTFVKGVGLIFSAEVISSRTLGRIEYEGKIYYIERILPQADPDQSITVTKTPEEGPAEVTQWAFHDKAQIYIEDAEDRTADKMTIYVADAIRVGPNFTIQNWEQVVRKETQCMERPLSGTRFDREEVL